MEKIRTFLRRRKVNFICSTLLRIRAAVPPVQITKNAKRGPLRHPVPAPLSPANSTRPAAPPPPGDL